MNYKNTIEEFRTKGYSLKRIATAVGLSTSALSQYLSGKYPGNVDKLEEQISQFIKHEQSRQTSGKYNIPFVFTSNSKTVFEACNLCQIDAEIGVVTGVPGTGKSMAVKEYAKLNREVILIEADLGYTTKVLFREIARNLNLDEFKSIHDLFEEVTAKLVNSYRLLIVDEAEHLPFRALDLLRRVYDKANVGIVLAGMPRLLMNLRGKKGEYAQLYSRVGLATNLQLITEDDCLLISKEALRDLAPADEITKINPTLFECSKRNTRTLSKILSRTHRLVNSGKELNHTLIRKVSDTLIV